MASTKHWGHVDETSFEAPPGHLIEITEPKAVVFEVPRLHQPSAVHHPPSDELPAKCVASVKAPLDSHSQNILLHSIELLHHKRRMRLMLMAAQHQQADSTMKTDSHETPPLPSMPPPPGRFGSPRGIVVPPGPMTILARAQTIPHSERHLGTTIDAPELDSVSNRQLLLRSVAAICAHSGFEVASESALESLTDIADDFLSRFCKLLRFAVDNEAVNGRSGFPDAMEYVLHETGLVGTMALHKYWISNVQEYALRLQQEDKQLISDYQQIADPSSKTAVKTEQEGAGGSSDLKVKPEDKQDLKCGTNLLYKGAASKDALDQSAVFSTTLSPFTVTGNGSGPGSNIEASSDPNSPHWSLNIKTEGDEEDYDDPMNVVPATPH